MKKYWLLWAGGVALSYFLGIQFARASEVQYCKQKLYDKIYKGIVIDSLMDKISIEVRNQRIEALRALCRGQKSTYEIGD